MEENRYQSSTRVILKDGNKTIATMSLVYYNLGSATNIFKMRNPDKKTT